MTEFKKDPRYPLMCKEIKKQWMDKGHSEQESQMLAESDAAYKLELESIFFKICQDCGRTVPYMNRWHHNRRDPNKIICGDCYDERYL
nr:hypothetical protein MarFTME_226 [Marseillevirus futianmevirus]